MDGRLCYGVEGKYGAFLDGSGESFYYEEQSVKDSVNDAATLANTALSAGETYLNATADKIKSPTSGTKQLYKSTADNMGTVGKAIDGAMLTWDLYDTWTNDNYNTNQKLASTAVTVTSTAVGFAFGAFATAAFNFWNPVGWATLALGVVSFVAMNELGRHVVSSFEEKAQTVIDGMG